ncbi:hypothetical protein ETD86_53140 [Nonomuraea turkmeniaca]|uniref:Uncharacterized protein n=1 Tax=Nonomuraea turkmeniaca TaxID=103838 RepID=A0A5S4EUT4_9ACTN|nr:hypothetical protein [Nonomuraea turkmeniaca]TMR05504.1 hypothetical protein ETD86_53140 [Nonomuraea turkmeniaca]
MISWVRMWHVAFREKIEIMIGLLPGSGRRDRHAPATATPVILVPRSKVPARTSTVLPCDATPDRSACSRATAEVTRVGAGPVAC